MILNKTGAQTGVTATSEAFVVNPKSKVSARAALASGSPATGAKWQYTLDDTGAIEEDTAIWEDTATGNQLATFTVTEERPAVVTALRLVVTDGTWDCLVRTQEIM